MIGRASDTLVKKVMIKKRQVEEVDHNPLADAPDLSNEAIARIREANRNLEEDFHPTSSLFSSSNILTNEEQHLGILAGLADADAGRTIPHAELKRRVKLLHRGGPDTD